MSSEAKMVSEREAVLRERAAWLKGKRAENCSEGYRAKLEVEAAKLFPVPKVERPRVVREEPAGVDWRFFCGSFEVRSDGVWQSPVNVGRWLPTPQRVKLWASLLASPTELVDDEVSVSSGTE